MILSGFSNLAHSQGCEAELVTFRYFVRSTGVFSCIISEKFQRVAMKKTTCGEISRSNFADRLHNTAAFAPYRRSPTALSSAFNVRFPQMAITSHAARKWLLGEAIPTQERLVALAHWLDVDPTWLRFGDFSGSSQSLPLQKNSDRIEYDLRLLTESERKVIRAALDAIFAVRQLPK
ncbi:hypothetical protein F2P44_21390 [Massilia sp. CCM 8695]|uniref:HTH cro/C1-type domain-containing protein n=1 Tax=Massilia frigida TaxID=2609281 RepID=A0ABX0N8T4_9BURK|nr:hypothetical protein [Massilia frigida]NHZ81810.1 hypothetical protein [Massilia frigida]